MPDPNTTETAAGSAASGGASQDTGAANALAQAVAAMVSASAAISDSVNQLKNLITSTKANSTVDDTNLEVSTVGNDDAFIGLRNERIVHNQVHAQMLRLLSAGVDHYVETNKTFLAGMAATAVQSGRHGDLAVARHWGTSPETANPNGGAPSK